MPYNPKKNGAANYKSWMQLTQAQIDALHAIEGDDNTEVPNDEQFAQVVYVLNSSSSGGEASGTIADGVDSNILATVTNLTNANALAALMVDGDGNQITSFGSSAIAEETVPTPVADGAEVNPWYDTFGRQVIFGANLSLNALDVNLINDSRLDRMSPVTNLSAVVANTTGSTVNVSAYSRHTVHIFASSVTDGANVNIEHSLDGTNWVVIATEVATADENNEYTFNEAYRYLRTSVSDYVDGTYTTLIYAGN